jgi:hypothetical protein
MATDDNTLFTVLFDGSPAKGAEALMEGFKRSYPGAWATLETLQRRQIKAAVEDQVERGFGVSIGSILAAGWNDVAKVREAIDSPTGDSRTISLLSHEFEWSTKPKLAITIDGLSAFDIEFDLVLSLDIEAAELTICDGAISEVKQNCYAKALKFATGLSKAGACLARSASTPFSRYALQGYQELKPSSDDGVFGSPRIGSPSSVPD